MLKTIEVSRAFPISGGEDFYALKKVNAHIEKGKLNMLVGKSGSGKTTLVRTLSIALGCDFRRLQFTPDLLPSDIVGMMVFN